LADRSNKQFIDAGPTEKLKTLAEILRESAMATVRDPVLKPVSIVSLRPTQITVGLREVDDKRKRLRKRPAKKIGKFLGHHMIPVILGPKDCSYIIDHHHLALALQGGRRERVGHGSIRSERARSR
jgi:hypothetical protein